jgi:hypothetical protein
MHERDRSHASGLIDRSDSNTTLYGLTGSHFLNNKKQSRVGRDEPRHRVLSEFARPSVFAPFRIRNYRFQWPSDLITSWAFEMETIILGWYVLVETGSVLLLTLFAALNYTGTLLAPLFGGDRIGALADRFAPPACAGQCQVKSRSNNDAVPSAAVTFIFRTSTVALAPPID